MDENTIKLLKEELPSNSHKTKAKKETEERETKKVIKGSVVNRKKSKTHKFTEAFFGDDIDNVGEYVIFDVVIPAVKKTLSDVVTGAVDMMLFGETRGRNMRRDGSRSYHSYTSYSSHNRRDDRPRLPSLNRRASHLFDDIVLDNRGDAEEVLSLMIDLVEEYGVASVADLYGFVDLPIKHTDSKYGWDRLSKARVERVRDGYMLALPKPRALD